jgi:lipopolysaccharide transport system ATP-binding protein
MSDVSIRVENLSKRYRIGLKQTVRSGRGQFLTDLVTFPVRNFARLQGLTKFWANDAETEARGVMWALRDISLEVQKGEVLGIVGPNGAGKTTLLKILSRITEPTAGEAWIKGRVGHLLEVGTGFHPELTGRENIHLNGAALGMTRKEIARKFDEIVDFSELESFIDTPAKRYSTGMVARLAFSVAAHLEPDVLLVDEVLSVGDAAFQSKCLGKMNEVAGEGRTVLFVSHNLGTLTRLCTRAIWVEGGRIKLSGSPRDVVGSYLSSGDTQDTTWIHPPDHCHDAPIKMVSARVLSVEDQATKSIPFNEQFKLEITYEVMEPILNTSIFGRLTDSNGDLVLTSFDTDTNEWGSRVREHGCYVSSCNFPGQLLRPGRYHFSVGSTVKSVTLTKLRRGEIKNSAPNIHNNVLDFYVSEVGYPFEMDRLGIVTPPLQWEVERVDGVN